MSQLSEFRRNVLKKSQQAISEELGYENWKTYAAQEQGKNPIPQEIKDALRGKKYKYTGPWPKEERDPQGRLMAQEEGDRGGGAYVTEAAFADVPGRLKRLEDDARALLPLIQAVRDLDERVRKLEKHLRPSE